MAKKNPSIFSTLQKTTANASAVNGEFTRQLPVDALEDNPMNRFSMAEDEQFTSTMASVETDGFLEDIVVTPSETEGRWRIISGHRRVHMARKLGKATVPCKVRHYPDKLTELRALMGANIHRRNITPFDMARTAGRSRAGRAAAGKRQGAVGADGGAVGPEPGHGGTVSGPAESGRDPHRLGGERQDDDDGRL